MINEKFYKVYENEMTRYKLRNKSPSETLNISQPSFIPNHSLNGQMADLEMTNSSFCNTSCPSPIELNDATLEKSFYINFSSSIILNKMSNTVQSSPMINKYDNIKTRTRIPVLPLVRIKADDYNFPKQTSTIQSFVNDSNKSTDAGTANIVKNKCIDVKSNNLVKKKVRLRKAVRHVNTKFMNKSITNTSTTSTPFRTPNRSTNMGNAINTGRNLTFSNQLQDAKINGKIELHNPHSILGKTNLKGLINISNWRTLQSGGCDMTHLLSLLPPPDAIAMSHNSPPQKSYVPSPSSVLNNEFLSSALVQWKTQLIRGEFKPKVPRQKRILVARSSKKVTKTIKKTTLKVRHKDKKNSNNHSLKKGLKKGSPPNQKSSGSESTPLPSIVSSNAPFTTSNNPQIIPVDQKVFNGVTLPQMPKYPHTSPTPTTQAQPEFKPKIGIIIRNNACQLMVKDSREDGNNSFPFGQPKREKLQCHNRKAPPDIPLLLPFIHPSSPPCNKLTSSTLPLAPTQMVSIKKEPTTTTPSPPPLLLPNHPMNFEKTKIPKHHHPKGPEFVIVPATMPNSCKFILRIKTTTDAAPMLLPPQQPISTAKSINMAPPKVTSTTSSSSTSAYQYILPKPPPGIKFNQPRKKEIALPWSYNRRHNNNNPNPNPPATHPNLTPLQPVISSATATTITTLPPLRLNHHNPVPANMYERFLSDLDPDLKRNFLASVAHTLQRAEVKAPTPENSGNLGSAKKEWDIGELGFYDNATESVSKLFRLPEQLNLTRTPVTTCKIDQNIIKNGHSAMPTLVLNGNVSKENEHICSTSRAGAMVKCSACGAFNHKQCPAAPSLDRKNGETLKTPKITTRASAHKCNSCGHI